MQDLGLRPPLSILLEMCQEQGPVAVLVRIIASACSGLNALAMHQKALAGLHGSQF